MTQRNLGRTSKNNQNRGNADNCISVEGLIALMRKIFTEELEKQ